MLYLPVRMLFAPPPGFSVYVLPLAAIDSVIVLPVPLPIRCGSYPPWLNQPRY